MRRTGVLSLLVLAAALLMPPAAIAEPETTATNLGDSLSLVVSSSDSTCGNAVSTVVSMPEVIDVRDTLVAPVAVISERAVSPMSVPAPSSGLAAAVSVMEHTSTLNRSPRRARGSPLPPPRSLFNVAGAVHNRLRLHATVRT